MSKIAHSWPGWAQNQHAFRDVNMVGDGGDIQAAS